MKKNTAVLVITHILTRNNEPVEGPYSSVLKSLPQTFEKIEAIKIPLIGLDTPIIYGENDSQKLKLYSKLGTSAPLKYVLDFFVTLWLVTRFCLVHNREEKTIIGIDPLCALPAGLLKFLFDYKLIFYSVDFNETRFENKTMQKIYELMDKWSSKLSDQVWVVCESLVDYKRENYGTPAIYIPNSTVFNPTPSSTGKPFRTGNKAAWTGTLMTERQYDIFFGVLKNLLRVRPDLQISLVPIKDHEKFQKRIEDEKLTNVELVHLYSRATWQEFLAKCDVGLAIYDPDFGSTKYIEPLKIWDFMMCGVPFIISCEPSISQPVKDSGVVYFLGPNNSFIDDNALKEFLEKKNLENLYNNCLDVARNYAIDKRINEALAKL